MTAFDRSALRRTTTAQQLAQLLSDRILDGAFSPGDRLRESGIAAEMGVARNTMREAVRILELTGLARYEVNRGAVVIAPTPESLEAVYLARERLETAAVAKPATPEQLARLDAAYRTLAAATRTRDSRQIVEMDLAFHATVVSFLESSRLDQFYGDLIQELRFYLTVLSVREREFDRPRDLLAEHKVILGAVHSGDPDRATAAVQTHIRDNAAKVKRILGQQP